MGHRESASKVVQSKQQPRCGYSIRKAARGGRGELNQSGTKNMHQKMFLAIFLFSSVRPKVSSGAEFAQFSFGRWMFGLLMSFCVCLCRRLSYRLYQS